MASTALISGRARNREIAMDFPTLLGTIQTLITNKYRYEYSYPQ